MASNSCSSCLHLVSAGIMEVWRCSWFMWSCGSISRTHTGLIHASYVPGRLAAHRAASQPDAIYYYSCPLLCLWVTCNILTSPSFPKGSSHPGVLFNLVFSCLHKRSPALPLVSSLLERSFSQSDLATIFDISTLQFMKFLFYVCNIYPPPLGFYC